MKIIDAVSEVLNIDAINGAGYAATTTDTNGEELRKAKTLDFCLFHLTRALCGSGTVAYLSDGLKGDLTKHTLEMIRSIEFLDVVMPTEGK